MSDTYLSWSQDADAGKIGNWDVLAEWIHSLDDAPSLTALVSDGEANADNLEAELAEQMPDILLRADDGDELTEAACELLYAVIARKPGQEILHVAAADGDFEQPTVLDWVLAATDEWDAWTPERRSRTALLLKIQDAIDTDPDEDEGRNIRLTACLQLLMEFSTLVDK